MKRFKLAVIGLTLLSSLAFANFNDVPRDHWAFESVRNLYNKGLLAKTVEESPTFKGEEAFTRYEIASMLFLSLQNVDEKIDQKANLEDVAALKALLTNFAPELAKMGLEVKATDKKLADLEKQIGGKLKKQINSLKEKMNKVKVSGNFNMSQEMGLKENSPGLEDLEVEGNIAITGKVTDKSAVKVNIETTLDGEDTEANAEVTVIEGKYKSDKFLVTGFRDKDKEVPNFEDTFALFSGVETSPEQGVIISGNYEIKGNKNTYTGMYFNKDDVNFFALQAKQKLNFLEKKGVKSFVRLSYTELIDSYQYDVPTGDQTTDPQGRVRDHAQALYSIDSELSFSPVSMLNLNFAGQFATRRSPNTTDIDSPAMDYLPVVGEIIGAKDAIYLYMSGKVKKTGITFAGGLYNSGEHFDIGGLGNNTKPIFAESSLVQVEPDKKSVMGKIGYDVLDKGIILTDLSYTTYGDNAEAIEGAGRLESNITYNAIKNKLRLELLTQIDKEQVEPVDQDLVIDATTTGAIVFEGVEKEKGMFLIRQTTSLSFLENASQKIVYEFQDDKDKDDAEDTDRYYSIYAENEMTIKEDILFNTSFTYKDSGLGLKNYYEYKIGGVDGNTWEQSAKNKAFDKYQELQLTAACEVPTEKFGTFNVGATYFSHDEQGGSTDGDGFVVDAGASNEAKDTSNEKDKEDISLFASNRISFGKVSLTYGLKYLIEKEGNEYVNEETKTEENQKENGAKYWTFEDKSKSEGGEYELLYALGVEYDFGNDVIVSFNLGDPTISSDSKDFTKEKTSFADGEADQFTFEVAAKF